MRADFLRDDDGDGGEEVGLEGGGARGRFDRVLVVHDGKVLRDGTFQQLRGDPPQVVRSFVGRTHDGGYLFFSCCVVHVSNRIR